MNPDQQWGVPSPATPPHGPPMVCPTDLRISNSHSNTAELQMAQIHVQSKMSKNDEGSNQARTVHRGRGVRAPSKP